MRVPRSKVQRIHSIAFASVYEVQSVDRTVLTTGAQFIIVLEGGSHSRCVNGLAGFILHL